MDLRRLSRLMLPKGGTAAELPGITDEEATRQSTPKRGTAKKRGRGGRKRANDDDDDVKEVSILLDGDDDDEAAAPPSSSRTPSKAAPVNISEEVIEAILTDVDSDAATDRQHVDRQLEATQRLRSVLSQWQNPPVEKVLQHDGLLGKLVEFLQRIDNPKLQFEAAWVLTNVAANSHEASRLVVEQGAVPIFLQLVASSEDFSVKDQVGLQFFFETIFEYFSNKKMKIVRPCGRLATLPAMSVRNCATISSIAACSIMCSAFSANQCGTSR